MLMGVRSTGIGRLGQQSITDIITAAANQYGVPPQLALAQAQQESGMNPNAIGGKGEVGLFQLMPQYFGGQGNLSDPATNANLAMAYLSQQYSMTGDWRDALIAYNEGPTAWNQGQRYASSQTYADTILANAGIPSGPQSAQPVQPFQVPQTIQQPQPTPLIPQPPVQGTQIPPATTVPIGSQIPAPMSSASTMGSQLGTIGLLAAAGLVAWVALS